MEHHLWRKVVIAICLIIMAGIVVCSVYLYCQKNYSAQNDTQAVLEYLRAEEDGRESERPTQKELNEDKIVLVEEEKTEIELEQDITDNNSAKDYINFEKVIDEIGVLLNE